jgi:branched-chain amino acid transport system permease protein
LDANFILAGVLNGLLAGGIYVLVAVGLTLIYGVLHIINFAHGSLLMLAMYAVFFLWRLLGIDPYVALPLVTAGAFIVGFVLYRLLIGRFYAGKIIELGVAFLPMPKVVSFGAALLICLALGLFMARTDTGKAIRAVAKERQGARLAGIDVEKIFAVSYGIGIACLGAAACLLMPTFYVTPQSGYAFVLVAFTIVVLGGMGSFVGAAVGGFLIGVTESLGGLFLGEQLGQIGISLIFILILLFKPTGLFGAKA